MGARLDLSLACDPIDGLLMSGLSDSVERK
jgi:hypothetical protein